MKTLLRQGSLAAEDRRRQIIQNGFQALSSNVSVLLLHCADSQAFGGLGRPERPMAVFCCRDNICSLFCAAVA